MRLFVACCSCLLMAWGSFASEFHDFMDTQGRSIRGKIMRYDARTKMVTIQRDNRKLATVPLSIFSEKDQVYICEWNSSKSFTSDSSLRITCDDRRVEKWKKEEWQDVRYTDGNVEKEQMKVTTFERMVFDVELQNKSQVALDGLRMEYIIYYEQSEEGWDNPKPQQKTLPGELDVPTIPGRNSIKLTTSKFVIHRDNINQKSWVSGRVRTGGEGEIHGIRCRLYMKTKSGKEIMREISSPDSLSTKKYPWKS